MDGKNIIIVFFGLLFIINGIQMSVLFFNPQTVKLGSILSLPYFVFAFAPWGYQALDIGSILFYIGVALIIFTGIDIIDNFQLISGLVLAVLCAVRLMANMGLFQNSGFFEVLMPYVMIIGGALLMYSSVKEQLGFIGEQDRDYM